MQVAVIEGEDASPEAIRPSVALIDSLGLGIEWVRPVVGEEAVRQFGTPFPDEARDIIDASATTYFGATSGGAARALFYLRWGKQTFANVRPAKYYNGASSPLASPEGIDFVIVRENLEDLYLGIEGEIDSLKDAGFYSSYADKPLADFGEGRFAMKAITRDGTERVVRFSFELARRRAETLGRPGRLTCTSKYNILPKTDGYFREIARDLSGDYPDVAFETFIADDFLCRMVSRPHDLDVVVMPNLYGDLMSDGAAGLIGGLGLAPSGCYGSDYAYFESAHGTAPDIAGQNIINPTATLLAGAMMLDHLGFATEAERLERAVARVYAARRVLTPDQGGDATTTAFCEAVAAELR